MDPKPSKYSEIAKAAKKQRKKDRIALEKLQNQMPLSDEPLPIHTSRPHPGPPPNAPSGPRAMEERRNVPGIRSRGSDNSSLSQQVAFSSQRQPNIPLSLRPFLINSQQYYAFDDDEAQGEALDRSQVFPAIGTIDHSLPAPVPSLLPGFLKSTGLSIAAPSSSRPIPQPTNIGVSTGFNSVQINLPNDLEHLQSNDEDVIFTPPKAVRRALPVRRNASLQAEEPPIPPSIYATPLPARSFDHPSPLEHSQAGQAGLFDQEEPYVLDFGKYEGKTLAQVQEIDVTYITWLKKDHVSNRQPGLAEGLAAHDLSEEAGVTREQLRAAAAEYPITWGKYAGVALKDIPKAYRQWLIDDGAKSRPKVVEMLKLLGHRKKQPITSPIPSWWRPADMKSDTARSFLDDYNRKDNLISPFDALRFFGLPKAYYQRLPNSDGNHWLYQVYKLLAACEGKQRAEAALEDFLTHNSDREVDGFIV